jgi:hypothetical protein
LLLLLDLPRRLGSLLLLLDLPRRLGSLLLLPDLPRRLGSLPLLLGLPRRLDPLPLLLGLPHCLEPLSLLLGLPRHLGALLLLLSLPICLGLLVHLSGFLRPSYQDRLQTADQSLDVLIEIAAGIYLEAVTVDQILEAIGKLFDVRHRSTLHQDWNDRHPVAEGRLDFNAYWIGRIVDPPSFPWLRSGPTFADDDERDIGLSKDGSDVLSKIYANRDVIDVQKDGSDTIMSDKTIKYSPGDPGGIISSI